MKSPSKKGVAKRARPAPARSLLEALRPWLLAGFVALCVARPLLPSEGASWLGDGQPFIMLALILTGGYLLTVAIHGQFMQRFNLVDASVAALVAICVASALAGASSGSPRMSLNMLWEWVGVGLVYFLARLLVRTAQEARGLVAVMFALAVVLSSFGYYQVFVGLPADRAAYAENPDQTLRSAGQWYPAGSPERQLFENRLQSTEPLATFALTNSLAGFLAPWLLVALGIGGSMLANRPGGEPKPKDAIQIARIVGFALSVLAVAGCFVLTKSRSGYVALAVGIALLPVALGAGRRMLNWRFALFVTGTLLMLVGGAVAIKGLDAKVLTEASKSFGYRLEYWQATLGMIGNYPVLGVGPGNFQDFYTQYKLPQASEEIRDPHNFLLEVWATSGSFALIALGIVLIAFVRSTWRPSVRTEDGVADDHREPGASGANVRFIAAGGVAGAALAFLIGPLFGHVLSEAQLGVALLLGGAVVAILWPWVIAGALPRRVLALGVLVLSIHWLAAGGIAFPGVAGTFWLLLALGLRRDEVAADGQPVGARRWILRLIPIASLGLICAATVACYYSAYGPNLRYQAAMSQANEVTHPVARAIAFLDATAADPLAPEPWLAIAELELEQLKRNPTSEAIHQRFVAATTRAMELQPQSSATWQQIGHWYMELFEANHDPRAADTAMECFRGAVRMYPNSAMRRAEFALALEVTGRPDAARHHAEEALKLSRETPHADKKLSAALESRLETLVAEHR